MAEKTSTKIDSVLQGIKHDGVKPTPIHVPQQSEMELDVLGDSTGYEMQKRRKTSIQDEFFGDNLTINYAITPEGIPYAGIPSIAP